MGRVHRQANAGQQYAADSLPVPVCDNIRIRRSRLYPPRAPGGAFRGYVASKRRFFYGLHIHLLITAGGQPVEMALAPGAEADIIAFRQMTLDLPEGARVFADVAYLDAGYARAAGEAAEVALVAQQRGNSRDPLAPWMAYLCDRTRKRIETTFSQIAVRFARSIHAVTPRGFELKVFLTVLAYAITAQTQLGLIRHRCLWLAKQLEGMGCIQVRPMVNPRIGSERAVYENSSWKPDD